MTTPRAHTPLYDQHTFDVLNEDAKRWGLWVAQRNSIEDAIAYERHVDLLYAMVRGQRVLH